MKKLALIFFLAAIATPAGAEPLRTDVLILPPLEYDHPFPPDRLFWRRYYSRETIKEKCDGKSSIACAQRFGDNCEIIALDDDGIKAAGYLPGWVFRHEIGHCNGWRSHEGARKAPAWDLFIGNYPPSP